MSRRQRVLAFFGIVAVLALLAPFVFWQFLGPERFDDLDLGAAPVDLLESEDYGNVDDDGTRLANLTDEAAAAEPTPTPTPIELPPLVMSETTRVTLIFSVGSDGMTQSEASRLRVADIGDRGSDKLTDSMLLLISDPATRKAALLSVPRDLWLSHRGHRINETFVRRGIQAFVDDVSRVAAIPVHHVVQVNFTAFADLITAVDGVALEVTEPIADLHSTLYVPEPGCWRFSGADALAYARSRKPLTTRDGGATWRNAKGGNDFTRMARQQGLLVAAWDQVRGPGFVKRIPALIDLARGMRIDDGLGLDDVRDLARSFSDVAAGRVDRFILPTVDRRVGQAQVLGIDWRRALPLYRELRAWPGAQAAPVASDEPSPEPSSSASAQPSPSPTASPSSAPSQEEESEGVGGTIGSVVGEPSEEPSSSPSPAPSEEPEPEPTQPEGSVDESQTPHAISGCSKANSWELPPNPLDYLHQISEGEPVTPYRRTRTSDRGKEPSGEDDGDAPEAEERAADEPPSDEAEPADPEPSPEPSAEPSDPEPDPEPDADDGPDAQGDAAPDRSEPVQDASDQPDTSSVDDDA